ncbi:MAG: glycosyltransferase [Lachnospiraceae bacterium]|nr:glycosyltransferase [Lachnospiraceae bacterium]MDE7274831.1 glycosyltransferase [Lachnospiraceae bacterium]
MAKIPVSVCIIAKNEEKHIEECLRRLSPYGFEIVVTDTGSTDRTLEIAQKYTDKVYTFEWVDDFSAARNFCAAHASNNWILVLDCDEYVHEIDVPTLRIMMQKFPRSIGEIRLKSITQNRGNTVYVTDDVSRFYNKNYYLFEGQIHEQLRPKDDSKKDDPMNCVMLPMDVIHHGYNLTPEEMERKQERNLAMLYKALETDPSNTYLLFQAGQSETMRGKRQEAIALYEKALGIMEEITCEYEQIMIMSLAVDYVKTSQPDKAVDLMAKYADQCQTARYMFTHGNVLLDSGNKLKALLWYIKATAMPDANTLGVNLMHCYENIIKIYMEMGNVEMAELFRARYEECRQDNERVVNS